MTNFLARMAFLICTDWISKVMALSAVPFDEHAYMKGCCFKYIVSAVK